MADFITLRARALIIPQDRWAQHVAVAIQQHQPMHLAGQPEPADFGRIDAALGEHAANALDRSIPPKLWILFAPERLGRFERVFGRGYAYHSPLFVHEQRFCRCCG